MAEWFFGALLFGCGTMFGSVLTIRLLRPHLKFERQSDDA